MTRPITTLGLTLIVLVSASISAAQVVLDPGTTSPDLQATGCSDTVIGLCTSFQCHTDCRRAQNRADAQLVLTNTDLGELQVVSRVYSEFSVSSSAATKGNLVSASLSYDIGWEGIWSSASAFLDNDPSTTVTLLIRDRTSGNTIETRDIHSIDPGTIGQIEIIDIGEGQDIGSRSGGMALQLVRGHTYRVILRISIEATGYPNVLGIRINYYGDTRGAWWNNLKIRIAPDLTARVALLEERVDSLEVENRRLREDLEDHTHTYLTGRGEGHNNTEATTSMAIIMERDSVDESELTWLGDAKRSGQSLPTKSVLLSNYPNPSNPATTLRYTIPEAGHVLIKIYNTLGQAVRTLVDRWEGAGVHETQFDGGQLASGVYYYRLRTGDFTETRKLTVLK